MVNRYPKYSGDLVSICRGPIHLLAWITLRLFHCSQPLTFFDTRNSAVPALRCNESCQSTRAKQGWLFRRSYPRKGIRSPLQLLAGRANTSSLHWPSLSDDPDPRHITSLGPGSFQNIRRRTMVHVRTGPTTKTESVRFWGCPRSRGDYSALSRGGTVGFAGL